MRRTIWWGVVGTLAFVWAAPAGAQAPVVRKVEFADAIKQAIDRNPTVALASAAIDQARVLVNQARTLTRPTVTATFTNVTLDSQRGFSGGVTQPQNQSAFGATAALPLLAPTAWAGVNQARDRVELAAENSAETRRQIALATAEAYLAVIAAERLVDVDQRALDAARAHLDYAQKRLEGGVGSRLNQVRAAQAATSDEARLENTRLGLARAQEALGVLLVEDGPVDAGAAPVLDPPPAGAEGDIAASRPDLRAQAVAVRAAERVVNDTWKAWLPTASVAFSPEYITPAGLFQPSNTWRLVFSLNQNLFDTRPRVDRALREVLLTQARVSRTAAEIQARSEIRIAREAVESYERALERSRLAADQANDVVQISTAAFEVGATTNLEVIDAQRSARDAETDAASAEDAVRRARLELLVALGRFPQ
jgi:outer membrane protein TolC